MVELVQGCSNTVPLLYANLDTMHLFSLSISQSYIPAELHLHLIKLLFKSEDRSLVQNYRPISLLCVTSKVLERIIFNDILQFVQDKISRYWSSFMLKHSTLQQLLILLHTIVVHMFSQKISNG